MNPEDVTDWKEQWREVEFEDCVSIIGIERGRSAAHFTIKSSRIASGVIFLEDMMDMMSNSDVVFNTIEGVFQIVKRGYTLGIRLKRTPKRRKPSVVEMIEQEKRDKQSSGVIIPFYL